LRIDWKEFLTSVHGESTLLWCWKEQGLWEFVEGTKYYQQIQHNNQLISEKM
jgi:hypothetical protein